jgi:hypothetical protein
MELLLFASYTMKVNLVTCYLILFGAWCGHLNMQGMEFFLIYQSVCKRACLCVMVSGVLAARLYVVM